MKIHKLNDFKGGWVVGDFEPAVWRTTRFEVCCKFHPKGESWPAHYHRQAVEINILTRGKMQIQGKLLESGDVFVIYPNEVADPEFLEDCEVTIIKIPSVPGDKYEV